MRFLAILLVAASPAFAAGTPDPAPSLAEAEAAIAREDFAAAIPLLREVTAAEPESADALNLLGFASRRSGALEEASAAYEAALALDPGHLGALEYQGELFVLQGETAMAEANLAKLAELCGDCEERAALAEAIETGEGW